MRTRSEAYFLELFGSATLRGAVEAAAQSERFSAGETSIPVDVYKLAAKRGFTIVEDLFGPACEEGQLLPISGGYRVRLRGSATEARKRFSLAHEIGHSYFYRDEGVGPRHVIGILNSAERSAEEKICNLFAGTLLMPSSVLRKQLHENVATSPASISSILQRVATNFRVSIPALLMRIGILELEQPTCLLIWSTFKPNPRKQTSPKLRIEFSLGLGEWSNRRFWNDTPVADAKIVSALRIYDSWTAGADCETGRFVVAADGTLSRDGVPCESPEPGIIMSRRIMGLWKREVVQCISSSALYSWKAAENQPGTYVVTVIMPASS